MYTRPRPTAGYQNGRNPNSPNVGYPIQNAYQQGGFPSPQQGNYKLGNAPNAPSLRAPQTPASQLMQPRSMQMKNQLPYQQQQSPQQQQMKPQPQQQPSPTTPPQPPRLKPILKQPSTSQHQQAPANPPNIPPATQPVTPTVTPTPVPVPPPPKIVGLKKPQGNPGPQGSQAPQIEQGAEGNQGNLENQGNPENPAVQGNQGNPGNQAGQGGEASQDPNCPLKSDAMDTDLEDLPKWRRKAGPKNAATTKINKKLKRLRLNQRLRRTLQPKNAIMVLNEMKAGVQFTFPENQGSMPNSLYVVHAELGGKTYVGQGLSKPLARQSAAENALKALLLEKMTAATVKARMDAESESQSGDIIGDTASLQNNSSEDGSVMDCDETNEIPWSSLASFALYKLFLEWHNQGTSVPVPRPGLSTTAKGIKREATSPQKNPAQKELPPNPTSIHPVMLLNQMRSGLTYVEINRIGNPPNTMFTLGVEIDGVEYTGAAKNKKDAKKVAAKAALCALYGLTYPEDTKPVLQDQVQLPEVQML